MEAFCIFSLCTSHLCKYRTVSSHLFSPSPRLHRSIAPVYPARDQSRRSKGDGIGQTHRSIAHSPYGKSKSPKKGPLKPFSPLSLPFLHRLTHMECRFQPLKSKSISFPFCSASFEVIHPSPPRFVCCPPVPLGCWCGACASD